MKRNLRLLLIATALLLTAVGARATRVGAQNAAQTIGTYPKCRNVQLVFRPDRESGAAGHFAVMYAIHKISADGTCEITGYPGPKLFDPNFHSLPTHAKFVSSLFGQRIPGVAILRHGDVAYFVMEWSDVPTGNESCPGAAYIMLGVSGDRLPDVTYASLMHRMITPCGGRITVSTVQKTAFPI